MTKALNLEGVSLLRVAGCTTEQEAIAVSALSDDADVRARTMEVWRAFEHADAVFREKGFPDPILKAFRTAGLCLGWTPEKSFLNVSLGKADDVDMRWFDLDRMRDGSAVQHFRAPSPNGGVGIALRVKGRELRELDRTIQPVDTFQETPISVLHGLVVFLQVGEDWTHGNSFALTAVLARQCLHKPLAEHTDNVKNDDEMCDNCAQFHLPDPTVKHKAAFIQGLLLGGDPAFVLEGQVDQLEPTLPPEAAEPEEEEEALGEGDKVDEVVEQPPASPVAAESQGCCAWFCSLFASIWAYFFGD